MKFATARRNRISKYSLQALELGTVIWFAVPACLALGGVMASGHDAWWTALRQITLPFDAAGLYAQALTAPSVAERLVAACELGHATLEVLEKAMSQTSA